MLDTEGLLVAAALLRQSIEGTTCQNTEEFLCEACGGKACDDNHADDSARLVDCKKRSTSHRGRSRWPLTRRRAQFSAALNARIAGWTWQTSRLSEHVRTRVSLEGARRVDAAHLRHVHVYDDEIRT
jgi:hypothetical protein